MAPKLRDAQWLKSAQGLSCAALTAPGTRPSPQSKHTHSLRRDSSSTCIGLALPSKKNLWEKLHTPIREFSAMNVQATAGRDPCVAMRPPISISNSTTKRPATEQQAAGLKSKVLQTSFPNLVWGIGWVGSYMVTPGNSTLSQARTTRPHLRTADQNARAGIHRTLTF